MKSYRAPRPRNMVVVMMRLTRKGGSHRDRRAHQQRNACREKVNVEE